jgi:hypothetical protein
MRTDGHARLKSIKVMAIQNVSRLSARCPATINELKTRTSRRDCHSFTGRDREGNVKPFPVSKHTTCEGNHWRHIKFKK